MADWSKEEDARLAELWIEEPSISTTEIGRKMGRTKSAITGRARRLHLPRKANPVGPSAVAKSDADPMGPLRGARELAVALTHSAPKPVIAVPPKLIEPPPGRYRRVIECQWVTERGPFLWDRCEEKTLPGKSYCSKHIVGLSYRVRDRSADVAAQSAGDD